MKYWNAIYCVSCILVGILAILAMIVIFVPKWNRLHASQQTRENLVQENAQTEEEIKDLIRRQQDFRTDPAFVEQTARDIGMVKSNEVVFKIVQEPAR